jgi:hypothetical protein
MIRRSTTLQDGSPGWLLISQRAHAHLAAELAYQWTSLPEFGPPDDYRDLLSAIRHHDDGWQQWDRHWYENTADGVPVAFHEMDPAGSNRIWQASIDSVQSFGPLVTYIVARHFLRMRERSSSVDPSGSSDEFIDRNQSRCERCLAEWGELRNGTKSGLQRAELAVDGLQFFDHLSLILCLGEVNQTIELSPPIPPSSSLHFVGPWQIQFSPNPLTKPTSVLQAEALEVPAGDLDAKGLKHAAVPCQLRWHLSGELL